MRKWDCADRDRRHIFLQKQNGETGGERGILRHSPETPRNKGFREPHFRWCTRIVYQPALPSYAVFFPRCGVAEGPTCSAATRTVRARAPSVRVRRERPGASCGRVCVLAVMGTNALPFRIGLRPVCAVTALAVPAVRCAVVHPAARVDPDHAGVCRGVGYRVCRARDHRRRQRLRGSLHRLGNSWLHRWGRSRGDGDDQILPDGVLLRT
jgi:hypothetical protein